MFAVCVSFSIKPECFQAFMALMQKQAENSLRLEDQCHRFDVLTDDGAPNRVFLYELYTDHSAFDGHLASDHFKEFDRAVADMVTEKQVETWHTVFQPE